MMVLIKSVQYTKVLPQTKENLSIPNKACIKPAKPGPKMALLAKELAHVVAFANTSFGIKMDLKTKAVNKTRWLNLSKYYAVNDGQ